MNALGPRSSRRMADEVYRILHRRIITGELAAGARVEIEAIARELDISSTPVREAVLQLESVDLVERQAYRGTVVRGVDPGRFAEVTAIRIELEGLAAQLGASRLTDDDLERMRELLEQMGQRANDADFSFGVFNDLNRAFHDVLYAAADSPILYRTIGILGSEADRIRLHFDLRKGDQQSFHVEILEACQRRDPQAAAEATRRHVLEAYFNVVDNRDVPPGALSLVLRRAGLSAEASS